MPMYGPNTIYHGYISVPVGSDMQAHVWPMTVVSEPQIHGLDPEERGCYLKNEAAVAGLKLFRQYSKVGKAPSPSSSP